MQQNNTQTPSTPQNTKSANSVKPFLYLVPLTAQMKHRREQKKKLRHNNSQSDITNSLLVLRKPRPQSFSDTRQNTIQSKTKSKYHHGNSKIGVSNMIPLNIASHKRSREFMDVHEPIAIGPLPENNNDVSGKICYLRAYNRKHPNGSTIKDLYQFISSKRHLKTTTKYSIASYFGFVLREYFGPEYSYDINLRQQIHTFVSHFYKSQPMEKKKTFKEEKITDFILKASLKTGLIVHFLFHTAMRINEMRCLKWSDCMELENGEWEITFIQKGKRRNTICVDGKLMQTIQRVFKGKTYLFEKKSGIKYSYSGLRKRIGKESLMHLGCRMKAHDLRRAYATHMVQVRGIGGLRSIMARGGWTSIAVFFQHYVHMEELKTCDFPLYGKCLNLHCDKDAKIEQKPEKGLSNLEKLRATVNGLNDMREAVAV